MIPHAEASRKTGEPSSSPRLRVSASPHLLLLGFLLLATVVPSPADEFDTLRLRWRDMLTFGTNSNPADTNYSAWISSVGTAGASYWGLMKTNAGRTYLWTDYPHLGSDSSDISGTYLRLRAMALAYAVHGSSLENNTKDRKSVISGLDWMYTNYYNERIT